MPMRARVKNGRLTLDEPTDLPEGTEVEVAVVDGDDLDDEDRARLHAAIDRGLDAAARGETHSAAEVAAYIRTRG